MDLFENQSKTNIATLGEFGLIHHLTHQYKSTDEQIEIGIGDDAAMLNITGKTLISSEIFVENIHFDIVYTPLKHLGYKIVSATLSDIAAMGGEPISISVNLAISSKYTVEALEELYSGIYAACEHYKISLIGGDTTSSHLGLIISCTAIGKVQDQVFTRNNAKEHELLCVSGDLGGAYMGLQLLEREKLVFKEHPEMQPDLDAYPYLIQRQLKPEARFDIIALLKQLDIVPTSMIDISDGLSSEILHLSKQSQIGVRIFDEKLPIDMQTIHLAKDFSLDHTMAALHGGQDYELLFTIKQSDLDKLKGNMDITMIGYTTDYNSGCKLITQSGIEHDIIAQGWVKSN